MHYKRIFDTYNENHNTDYLHIMILCQKFIADFQAVFIENIFFEWDITQCGLKLFEKSLQRKQYFFNKTTIFQKNLSIYLSIYLCFYVSVIQCIAKYIFWSKPKTCSIIQRIFDVTWLLSFCSSMRDLP